MQLLSVHRK